MIKTKTTKVARVKTSQDVLPSKIDWTPEQVDLIKRTVAKGATDDELKLFLYTAHRTQLDPLTRQIFFVKRWNSSLKKDVGAIQTGIDGYRAIAERTGQMAGSDDVIFEENSTTKSPTKATVTVYRVVKGIRVPFTASARWSEYCPRNSGQAFMWDRMPYLMLGKVAEALALRKAFPLNLSGIYTTDEMAQAEPDTPVVEVPKIALASDIEVEVSHDDYSEIKTAIWSKLTHLDPSINAKNIHQRVLDLTGEELKPENYDEIDSRLAILLDEKSKK